MKWADPGAPFSIVNVPVPSVARRSIVLFARVCPALKLIVDVPEGIPLPGKSTKLPAAAGWVTVTFTETAFTVAPAGTPHWPARTNVRRAPFPERAGPPYGPFAFRVSRTRHGVSVKKLVEVAGGE